MSASWMDPRKTTHHALLGHMEASSVNQIGNALRFAAPTNRQLDELAVEELLGLDRGAVLRLLWSFHK